MAYPVVPAVLSPDGIIAQLVYRGSDNRFSLVATGLASGKMSPLLALPTETLVQSMTPQWAGDDTELVETDDGPILLHLAPAA